MQTSHKKKDDERKFVKEIKKKRKKIEEKPDEGIEEKFPTQKMLARVLLCIQQSFILEKTSAGIKTCIYKRKTASFTHTYTHINNGTIK